MFAKLNPVKTDPILGLMAAYRQDNNSQKVDLGIGVYKDEAGHTPILKCVKAAERYRLENEDSKSYIGMAGDIAYNQRISGILFGEHEVIAQDRVSVVQTPGGTGALRVAAEFIYNTNPDAKVWVSKPTWANHFDLFTAAGLSVREYTYYDNDSHLLLFEDMLRSLEQVSKGDIVVLHACCHNPSGMDFNTEQWQTLCELAKEKGFLPLLDFAYQGFGQGLDEDAEGVRMMATALPELIVCSSCSKNFGLYRERIGACCVISESKGIAVNVFGALQNVARGIYSMPPAHGAVIVNTILASSELRSQWEQELAEMRNRINGLRQLVAVTLKEKEANRDFNFIQNQNGMFSFLGIDPEQVLQLRNEFSIYIVDSGRMNVAGINQANIDYFADSVVSVLR